MQLTQLSIQGPGSQGLNSEISPFQQSIEFALKADNAVIDRVGRLAAREAFADFVWDNNFELRKEETYDIVRMETVMYDQDLNLAKSCLDTSHKNAPARSVGRLCHPPLRFACYGATRPWGIFPDARRMKQNPRVSNRAGSPCPVIRHCGLRYDGESTVAAASCRG